MRMVGDTQNVLNRRKNFFNQVLMYMEFMMLGRWIYIRLSQLIPEPSLVEVENAIGKLKSHKPPGTDQIPAELIKAGVKHYILRYTYLFYME
jgi:hypothetical protein